MASIMPLTADEIDAICEIDDGEMPAQIEALMAKPAFAGLGLSLGLSTETKLAGFIYGWVFDGQGEIVQITIAEENRRQGHGRTLLTSFLADFDLQQCWLEVRADNDPAISLYQSIGFVEDGQRKGYYQPSSNDLAHTSAILMQWNGKASVKN